MKKIAPLIFSIFCITAKLYSQVRVPQIVSDSMILQRDARLKIWGWASAQEKITVKFNSKTYKTKADEKGNWSVYLSPMKAGGPYSMSISGINNISLKEILIGDVWLCSGQSNMEHYMAQHEVLYAKEIAEVNYPQIRQFKIPTNAKMDGPQIDVLPTSWKWANPKNIRSFTAVGYFFAKELYEKYHVPIGIINSTVGGTPIEAWTSEEGFKDFSEIKKIIEKNKDAVYLNSSGAQALNGNNNRVPRTTQDKGLTGPLTWFDVNYIPKGWRTIAIPGYWEDQGIKDLNGVVWYRKEVDVPASMIGKPAKVFLGRIVDADICYINGKQVGATTYMYPQRRYNVAEDVLTAGKNIFVVKVTNNNGKGGFVPDKPYYLFSGNDTIDLKGYWQYKVGEVFSPQGFFAGGGRGPIAAQNQPAALYNGMIAPLTNYTVKGFLWYQGEANTGKPAEYAKLQPAQISDWRNKWNMGELPFLFVQLPGFMDYNYLPSESSWAAFREAQFKSLSVSNTGMAVAIDLGEWNDIHPDNKKEVGRRLALLAEKNVYGENVIASGPLFQSATIEGNKINISFTNTGSGLISNDGEELSEFAIAGADKKFVWAKAKIEGDKVIVMSEEIAKPLYVRYAWADNPVNPNLYNKEVRADGSVGRGLPASPFRTDN
ncbi:MAG: sialate O-acetylesterase [Ferruginibacter sp.]